MVVSPSTDALGYGVDLDCWDDMSESMAELEPESPDGVAQALWHRLTTRAGSLEELDDDPDYGRSVFDVLHASMSNLELRAEQDLLRAECLKDDRVATCDVKLTQVGASEFELDVSGELYNGQVYTLVQTVSTAAELLEAMANK